MEETTRLGDDFAGRRDADRDNRSLGLSVQRKNRTGFSLSELIAERPVVSIIALEPSQQRYPEARVSVQSYHYVNAYSEDYHDTHQTRTPL